MGLCKCPRRKVTQQFCFEHKVNVCEFCMVNEHRRCVVQPYLQWLEDSTFSPNCSLCNQSLDASDCVRLLCYHVFHWECLNNYAASLPPNAAPAAFTCPDCQKSLFPPHNSTSPLAANLRQVLTGCEWARVGLGLPVIDRNTVSLSELNQLDQQNGSPNQIPHVVKKDLSNSSYSIPVDVNNVSSYINYADTDGGVGPRKIHSHRRDSAEQKLLDSANDDKYRANHNYVGRWFRSRASCSNPPNLIRFTKRRWAFLILFLIAVLIAIGYVFVKLGRMSADNDQSLDPAFNPMIRNELD